MTTTALTVGTTVAVLRPNGTLPGYPVTATLVGPGRVDGTLALRWHTTEATTDVDAGYVVAYAADPATGKPAPYLPTA